MPRLTSKVQYNTHQDGSVNQNLLVLARSMDILANSFCGILLRDTSHCSGRGQKMQYCAW